MNEDNREIMDIDYEMDVQCYRVMPQGKSVVETKSTCDGCRYNPEKCIINRLLILKSVINEGLKNAARTEASGKEPKKEIKDLSISDLGLSARSYHCLIRSGYLGLSDIIGFSYDDIAKIRNVGKKSADEIWQVIEKHRRVKE